MISRKAARPGSRVRTRSSHLVLALLPPVLLAGLLPACGGTASKGETSTASRERVEPPAKRCGPPARPAQLVTLRTADGVRLDGATVGAGARGVVLVHEAGGSVLCGWWPYAAHLAEDGFHVLLFDLRCYGLSECPGKGERNVAEDVAAAVDELRARGATSIELVGASYGGSVALVAAARLEELSALADLSGDVLRASIGGRGGPTTAWRAAPDVDIPTLLAVAKEDAYIGLSEERALYRRLGSPQKRMIVLPAGAGHGWTMLEGASGRWSRFERTLTAFLADHARAP
jgi:alpha-beta hydrolase superfamily lysophospholipase